VCSRIASNHCNDNLLSTVPAGERAYSQYQVHVCREKEQYMYALESCAKLEVVYKSHNARLVDRPVELFLFDWEGILKNF
jgi:hypothetical protein